MAQQGRVLAPHRLVTCVQPLELEVEVEERTDFHPPAPHSKIIRILSFCLLFKNKISKA